MIKNYPPGPKFVPKDFTEPTKEYKKRVWLASVALLGFVALYIGLCLYFVFAGYSLFKAVVLQTSTGVSIIGGVLSWFMAFILIKAFFFRSKGDKGKQVELEITRAQEPDLFAFIDQIADDVGAPRAHKVYLAPDVNAAVFYDLSILNLLFPSRKNLVIGLGLVNGINKGELKAILAHEFGHFAQRSMLVGRWTYTAEQIARKLIAQRDGFDEFLVGLCFFDIRFAWIGWILWTIVWAIRAIMETCFQVVVYAQRALSREMEFNADLAAVTVSGSDALINSLHRTVDTNMAYDDAINFANVQIGDGKAIPDLYAIQSNAKDHLARIKDDPDFGKSPIVPEESPQHFRVFKSQLISPAQMWSTHPSNFDREENAKKVYLAAPIDDTDAWELFRNALEYREKVTANLIGTAEVQTEKISADDALELHSKEYDHLFLESRFRGVYLNRPLALNYEKPLEVYHTVEGDLKAELGKLYDKSLVNQMTELNTLRAELMMLQAFEEQLLKTTEDIIYQGKPVDKQQLPLIIKRVKGELELTELQLLEHDKKCRSVHHQIAKTLDGGWHTYHEGLVKVLHYVEHTINDLNDATVLFGHVFSTLGANGRFSSRDVVTLMYAANVLHEVLRQIDNDKQIITVYPELLAKLEVEAYSDLGEKFAFERASQENIQSWMANIEGWIVSARNSLVKLQEGTLDLLLETEDKIAYAYLNGQSIPGQVPPPPTLPTNYALLMPGNERDKTMKLPLLVRLEIADGIGPTIARLAGAAAIIGACIVLGSGVFDSTKVYCYNGLDTDVFITIGEESTFLPPFNSRPIVVTSLENLEVTAVDVDGNVIDKFSPESMLRNRNYVYNVAGAGVLYRKYWAYGTATVKDNEVLPVARWSSPKADYRFTNAPKSIELNSQFASKYLSELWGVEQVQPDILLSYLEDETDQLEVIYAHAMHDNADSENYILWLEWAKEHPQFDNITTHRLARNSEDITARRFRQATATGELLAKYCEEDTELAEANPDNAGFQYLKCRCLDEGPAKDSSIIAEFQKFPTNDWLANASAFIYLDNQQYREAYRAMYAATKYGSHFDYLHTEMERLYRFLKDTTLERNYTMQATWQLDYVDYLRLNGGTLTMGSLDHYYYLMSKGKLEAAVNYKPHVDPSLGSAGANQHIEHLYQIQRLAAASDGADSTVIWKAYAMPLDAGINNITIFSAIGLKAKRGRYSGYYKPKLVEYFGDEIATTISEFTEAVLDGKLEEADQMVKEETDLFVGFRAHIYTIGVIILGDKAPAHWREFARDALFVFERPYFE